MANEDRSDEVQSKALDKLYNFCIAARALPGGGQLARFKQFMIDFVDTMYEETTGEVFAMPGAPPPSAADQRLLQTQSVTHGSQPMVVGPVAGSGVQLFAPGQIPGGPQVQLFNPGQAPHETPGQQAPTQARRVIPVPPRGDSAGGTVELIPPGEKPPTAPAAPSLPQGGVLTTPAHGVQGEGTVQIIPPPQEKK